MRDAVHHDGRARARLPFHGRRRSLRVWLHRRGAAPQGLRPQGGRLRRRPALQPRDGPGPRPRLHDGDYADALRKKYGVLLLVSESTGALSASVVYLLRMLARTASLPTGNDTTVYGTSRTSPQSFFPHHLAAISAAIAQAESHTLITYAATRNLFLTLPK